MKGLHKNKITITIYRLTYLTIMHNEVITLNTYNAVTPRSDKLQTTVENKPVYRPLLLQGTILRARELPIHKYLSGWLCF